MKFLLEGRLWDSFVYHPLVLYLAVVLALELAAAAAGRRELISRFDLWLIRGGIGLTAVNWVIKNVLLAGFGIDLLIRRL